MITSTRICKLTLLFLFVTLSAHADDEALYGKDAPDGAAFFRVLNISQSDRVEVAMNGGKVTIVEPLNISPYGYSTQQKTVLNLNGQSVSADTPAKSMTTLVWDGTTTFPISEEPFSSVKKARLKLFNISDEPVRLTTTDKKTEVIGKVMPQEYDFRDVNALTMPFTVESASGNEFGTQKIALKKGTASSLFFIRNGSSALFITSDETR